MGRGRVRRRRCRRIGILNDRMNDGRESEFFRIRRLIYFRMFLPASLGMSLKTQYELMKKKTPRILTSLVERNHPMKPCLQSTLHPPNR